MFSRTPKMSSRTPPRIRVPRFEDDGTKVSVGDACSNDDVSEQIDVCKRTVAMR
jgi:hypothetical protein